MKTSRIILGAIALLVVGVAGFAAGKTASSSAQLAELTKEHEWLQTLDGDYTAKMSGVLGESDATSKIESLGGLWSIRHFETSVMNQPFVGIEILGFDPLKKKFVSIWADSMTPLLMSMEGTYDAGTKTLTLSGLSRGMDGEVGEMVTTTEYSDDGMLFTMKVEGQPITTVDYKRKK